MASSPPSQNPISLPGRFFRGRRRQHGRPNLPLPVYAEAAHSALISCAMSESFDLLEDVIQHSFFHLRHVQNRMLYWQSRAEATKSQKIYSMIFERGPRAFFVALHQSWTILKSKGSLSEYFMKSQSDMVLSKLDALKNMQSCLASFVSQIYSEVDEHKEGLTENQSKSLHTVFLLLNTVFTKLEASLTNACEGQTLQSTHKICFKRLPEVEVDSSLTADAISLVYQNLQELDSFVSYQLSCFERPSRATMYWLPYTFGAIGMCACSLWLLNHNSLMGSCEMDGWIFQTKKSFSNFWDWHVEKPITSIRGEFMETYKRADKRVMEPEEVQFYKASVHRMLLGYFDQTSNVKLPPDVPLQVLVETFTKRFEKQCECPTTSTIFRHLPHAMFIKLQMSKLDVQEALLVFDQLLKENGIPLALLAAAPSFGLLLLLLFLVGAWAMHVKQAKGSGMVARRHQRQLLLYAREKLMGYQKCKESGMEEAASCKFGLMLYTLDRLYKVVELRAKRTGELSRVREDIFCLANPGTGIAEKLKVFSRLEKVYECLLKPLPSGQPHM